MRKYTTIIAVALLLIFVCACRHDYFEPSQPQSSPHLKRTVTEYSGTKTVQVINYNEWELPVTDTTYSSAGAVTSYKIARYNSKGKQTSIEITYPTVYTAGYYWLYESTYQDDTLLTSVQDNVRGKKATLFKYFYNNARQRILDSIIYTAIPSMGADIKKYEYNPQGKLASITHFNNLMDTTEFTSWQYSPGHTEKSVTSYYYYGSILEILYSKQVTDYDASGYILSEKSYSPADHLNSQTDYSYSFDAYGALLKKTTTSSSQTTEEKYYNNPVTHRPDKMESYLNGNLTFVKKYYYE